MKIILKLTMFFLMSLMIFSPCYAEGLKSKFHGFTHKAAVVGLQTDKQMNADLSLTTSMNKTVISKVSLKQQQLFKITILEIVDKKIKKILIEYENSDRIINDGGQSLSKKDPVVGKSYLIYNTAGKLKVTDIKGNIPTQKEIDIVKSNLSSLGKPNPLAALLNGRFLFEGQTIHLPIKMAKEMFGNQILKDHTKEVALKFVSVKVIDGAECAVFQTKFKNKKVDASSALSGTFVVQIETCRTVLVNFNGPVSTTQKIDDGKINIIRKGTLKISMSAKYSKKR